MLSRWNCPAGAVLAGSLALTFTLACGAAVAADVGVGIKAGALLEGAQNTLKSGAGLGTIVELRSSERWQWEFGFTYGQDPGGGASLDQRVTIMQIDARARRTLGSARVRPFLEAGLGVYNLDIDSTDPVAPGDVQKTSVGGPLGAGAAIALGSQIDLHAVVEYHWIAAETDLGVGLSSSSGNLEDYVWIGAAFTYRLASGK